MKQQEYQIEQILAAKFSRSANRYYYLVKWVNWQIEDSTWEPQENLQNAQEVIDQFQQKQKNHQIFFEWEKYQKFKQFWANGADNPNQNQKSQNKDKDKKKKEKHKKIQKKDDYKTKRTYNKKQKTINLDDSKDSKIKLNQNQNEEQKVLQQQSSMSQRKTLSVNVVSHHSSSVPYAPYIPTQKQQKQPQVQYNNQSKKVKLAPYQNIAKIYPQFHSNQQNFQPQNKRISKQSENIQKNNFNDLKKTYHRNHILLEQSEENSQQQQKIKQKKSEEDELDDLQDLQDLYERDRKNNCQKNYSQHQHQLQNQNINQNINEQNQQNQQHQQHQQHQPTSNYYYKFDIENPVQQKQYDKQVNYNFMQSSQQNQNNQQLFQKQFQNSQYFINVNSASFQNYLSEQHSFSQNYSLYREGSSSQPNQILASRGEQILEIIGLKRTGKKSQSQRLLYLTKDKNTNKKYWKTKKEVIQLCPISLINYYQNRMLFSNSKSSFKKQQ